MSIKDKINHYYKAWGDVHMLNAVLKIALFIVSFLFLISLIIIGVVANKPPLLISILPSGHSVVTSGVNDSASSAPEEITQFIQQFVEKKYNWTPENVESQFKSADSFLSSGLIKETHKKNIETIAYIKNTGLRQAFYLKSITATKSEFKGNGIFTVVGDRVIGIKNSKFTTDLKIVLTIEKTKRSSKKPHGLTITKLEEILDK